MLELPGILQRQLRRVVVVQKILIHPQNGVVRQHVRVVSVGELVLISLLVGEEHGGVVLPLLQVFGALLSQLVEARFAHVGIGFSRVVEVVEAVVDVRAMCFSQCVRS